MQAWQALVGSKCEAVLVCMCVCMSVCNGFMIEIDGFTHSLHTFSVCATHDAIAMEVEDSDVRRQHQNKSRCMEDG